MKDLLFRSRWVLLIAGLAAGAAFGANALLGADLAEDPLAISPADANLVISLDARALMDSSLWRAMLDDRGEGPRRIERTCGYDPLGEVERVVIFVSGDGDDPFGRVGFVARGEMARGASNRERLVGCVGRVLGEQGGGTRLLEIEGVTAMASQRGSSHAAFLGRDAVVGGDRDVVASTIRITDGELPSADQRADLRALHRRVADLDDVVVVARLPRQWLPALERMAGALPEQLDALISVRGLGLGVSFANGLRARAVLRADDAAGLADALQSMLDGALEDADTRRSIVGTALRRVRVEPGDGGARVALRVSDDVVEDLVALYQEMSNEPEPASVDDLELDDVGARGGGGALGVPLGDAVLDVEPGDDPGADHDEEEEGASLPVGSDAVPHEPSLSRPE